MGPEPGPAAFADGDMIGEAPPGRGGDLARSLSATPEGRTTIVGDRRTPELACGLPRAEDRWSMAKVHGFRQTGTAPTKGVGT